MTKEEYWLALTKKNSSFNGDSITISISSLKKIIFQAHDKGFEMGQNMPKMQQNDNKMQDLESVMSMFGIKR